MNKREVKNRLLNVVRTPLFKQRVVKDKTKYNRKVTPWQEHITKEDKL